MKRDGHEGRRSAIYSSCESFEALRASERESAKRKKGSHFEVNFVPKDHDHLRTALTWSTHKF